MKKKKQSFYGYDDYDSDRDPRLGGSIMHADDGASLASSVTEFGGVS